MKLHRLVPVAMLGALLVFSGSQVEASIVAKAAARVAMKNAAEKDAAKLAGKAAVTLAPLDASKKAASQARATRMHVAYQRDRLRDAKTPAKPLSTDRIVQRYTSEKQARVEAKIGLGSGIHTTSTIARGRPLSRENAQARYGLINPPEMRTTWVIPAGTKVKLNKVVGGTAGVGETRLSSSVPAANRMGRPVRLNPQTTRQ